VGVVFRPEPTGLGVSDGSPVMAGVRRLGANGDYYELSAGFSFAKRWPPRYIPPYCFGAHIGNQFGGRGNRRIAERREGVAGRHTEGSDF